MDKDIYMDSIDFSYRKEKVDSFEKFFGELKGNLGRPFIMDEGGNQIIADEPYFVLLNDMGARFVSNKNNWLFFSGKLDNDRKYKEISLSNFIKGIDIISKKSKFNNENDAEKFIKDYVLLEGDRVYLQDEVKLSFDSNYLGHGEIKGILNSEDFSHHDIVSFKPKLKISFKSDKNNFEVWKREFSADFHNKVNSSKLTGDYIDKAIYSLRLHANSKKLLGKDNEEVVGIDKQKENLILSYSARSKYKIFGGDVPGKELFQNFVYYFNTFNNLIDASAKLMNSRRDEDISKLESFLK